MPVIQCTHKASSYQQSANQPLKHDSHCSVQLLTPAAISVNPMVEGSPTRIAVISSLHLLPVLDYCSLCCFSLCWPFLCRLSCNAVSYYTVARYCTVAHSAVCCCDVAHSQSSELVGLPLGVGCHIKIHCAICQPLSPSRTSC